MAAGSLESALAEADTIPYELDLCNVDFAYGPSPPLVLNDVTLTLGAGEWLRPICEAHGCKASKNASSGAVRGSDARADFWMKRLSEWKAGVGKSARCAAFNLTVEGRRVRLRTTEGATRPK